MVRRDFLKVTGLVSAAVIAIAGPAALAARPVEAELGGLLYKGSPGGLLHVSRDGGKSWSLHTKFGSRLAISRLYVDARGRLVAVLDCEGYDFKLALARDRATWKTT